MTKNLFIPNLTCDYNIEVVEKLVEKGYSIKLVATAGLKAYDKIHLPSNFYKAIKNFNCKVIWWRDMHYISNISNKTFFNSSWLSENSIQQLSYYERLFLLSTDRNSFFPLSQIERSRIFYKTISYFYYLLNKHQIDYIFSFGSPYGYWAIALSGLAEYMNIKSIYSNSSGFSPIICTLENTMRIKKTYSNSMKILGSLSNTSDINIRKMIDSNIDLDYFVGSVNFKFNFHLLYIKKIISLFLKGLFKNYDYPELYLSQNPVKGYRFLFPFISYYLRTIKAARYYKNHSTKLLPREKVLTFFLHQQPEASSMPSGNIFADQLLAFDIISEALEPSYKIIIKEHPTQFWDVGQDIHERSKSYYAYFLKNKNVFFAEKDADSISLIKNSTYVASIAGSVGWQTMRLGKPCISFGASWFSSCSSCFIVDSVPSLKKVFKKIDKITSDEVQNSIDDFLNKFSKRAICAASCQTDFNNVEKLLINNFDQTKSAKILAKAIDICLSSEN